MFLRTLELHGFKSFPNRTVLHFERGTTVVVGPNGSGKSNISDAMRWVLGELSSRNIRGTKMEDVIFGGTDDRRPMGFAEVSVTFDNTDKEHHSLNLPYDEVVVTRRYYRAGESEYFINRKPCRLKDIFELFMNTGVGREGYSIIGQGRIAEILSKKSEDRRNFFEEAAGISKFRMKKQDAEKKLAEAESNMVRVRDILTMLETRVGPLKRDSEKARRYLELYEQKKRADVSLWLYDTQRLRNDIALAKDACALSENELTLVSEALASLEAQRDRLDEESRSNHLLSEQLMVRIRELSKKIAELDSAYQLIENDSQHRNHMIEECTSRIGEADATVLSLGEDIQREEAHVLELSRAEDDLRDEHLALLAEQQQKTIAAQEKDRILAEKLNEMRELETVAADVRVRLDFLRNTKVSDSDKSEGLLEEIRAYEAEGERLRAEAERCEKAAAGFKAKISEYDATITSGTEETDETNRVRAEKMDDLAALKVQRSTSLQRAETLRRMEEHFEGYSNSIRFIMNRYEQNAIRGAGKIYGPLSQLISTDTEYAVAIETALGASIQNIVVDNDTTAKAAINCLKEHRAGRATFYPVSSIRSSGETEEVRRAASFKGYVGRADKLVTFEPTYREIVEWLLVRTVVFDNIDNASVAAKELRYRVKIVTLDGQVINAGGSFTGGSTKHDSGILSRSAEIEKLTAEAEELEKAIREAEASITAIDRRLEEIHNAVRDAEQQKELLLTMSRAQFAALDSANAKLEANENLTAKLRADRDALLTTGVRCEEEIAELTAKLAELEKKIAEIADFRAACEVEKNALLDERDALVEQASAIQVRIAETGKDIEAARMLIANARSGIESLTQSKEAQRDRIVDHQAFLLDQKNRMEANRRDREVLAAELAEIDSDRATAEADGDEFARRLSELKIQINNRRNQKELADETHRRNERRRERLEEEYDRLGSKLFDDYELTTEDARQLDYPPVTAENHAEYVAVQTDCRQKIKALGSVNLNAIEEYEEVRVQYESLSEQVQDIDRSREELLAIVQNLENEMKASFIEAFMQINKNFGIVFRELFGGGQAELSLTDPEDVLSCGIEIKAAPPGKIIKNLSLLSGGEQAFVACALFFAILKVNPTPFCLLDEIEAALDEVNVYRLGEYIKRFCGETQFILITHRRGTMQIADRLYGVTMPERGISKVIAMDVNEIETKNKEFTDGLL